MTSYDDSDLKEAGYAFGVKDLVARRAGQARDAGIEKFIFVTGRNKNAINNHFDHAYELESKLDEKNKKLDEKQQKLDEKRKKTIKKSN